LTYVASGSIVERSLSSLRAFKEWSKENVKTRTTRSRSRTTIREAEQEKTKSLGSQFCRSGIGILRKGEVIP
ncbi:hypothetical protein T07_2631, partial [Trichinella nelsoni]